MNKQISFSLLIALMMFPQIVETIYSPVLTDISTAFHVSHQTASQTLSFYFIAFAVGIVLWGYLCDQIGRRPTVLIALVIYMLSSFSALFVSQFETLMLCRILMAFSAAIGSIGTQTIMRDQLDKEQLRYIFSIMGIALATSPIIGMMLGAVLTQFIGYKAVFSSLLMIAIILLSWTASTLPETKPIHMTRVSFIQTFYMMIRDVYIIKNALLIGLLNIALFAYYQLAPFMFQSLNLSETALGLSGLLLGLGSFLGAFINNLLIKKRHTPSDKLILFASIILFLSAFTVYLFDHSIYFIIPMIGIVMAYGIAIPNILSFVLSNYQDRLGTAGAILGLIYYLIIGLGLVLVGYLQNLGITLIVCGIFILILQWVKTES